MRTVLIFLNLGVLYCAVSSSLPSPINVVFSSVNLRNVLQWSPGNGTQKDTHFTVQYAIYGDNIEGSKGRRVHWRAMRQCMEIVRTWCDLSNETWDQEQGYYARVRAVVRGASSKWAVTRRRFDPKSDTTFGPPLVSVEIEGNIAIITLKGPVRYQPNNHTPVVSMATLYPQMIYNLSIHNAHHSQTHHFAVASSPYKYQLVEYNAKYCFSAKTRFLSMPVQCQSSEWLCITTPQDPVPRQLQTVVWAIVVPFMCVCVFTVVGYFLHNYLIGKGQKNPYILDPPYFHCPPVTIPSENINFILISVKDEDNRVCAGLFPNKYPQTGLFDVPLDPQMKEKLGMEVETDGRINGAVEEGSESENVALISAYASQNIMPTTHTDQSDLLPIDYGVLCLEMAHSTEEDDDDGEVGEEEGTLCINWDPVTRKLVVPETAMKFNQEGGFGNGLMKGEEGREDGMGREGMGKLRLENVFVRQTSGEEEEARVLRETETSGDRDDILNKWNLVISTDD